MNPLQFSCATRPSFECDRTAIPHLPEGCAIARTARIAVFGRDRNHLNTCAARLRSLRLPTLGGGAEIQAFTHPDRLTSSTWDLIILTFPPHRQGQLRGHRSQQANINTLQAFVPTLARRCPHAIFLVVGSAVDLLTLVVLQLSGLPHHQVLGSGTVYNSARFRLILSAKLQVHPSQLPAYLVGRQGIGEIPLWHPEDNSPFKTQFHGLKHSAYELLAHRPRNHLDDDLALGLPQIVKAILLNTGQVLTVSRAYLGACLSLPTPVSRHGVGPALDLCGHTYVERHCQQSARQVREAMARIVS